MCICSCNQISRARCHLRNKTWEFRLVEHEHVSGFVFKRRVHIIIMEWDNKEHEHYYFKKRPDIHIFCSPQDILNVCSTKGKAVTATKAAALLHLKEADLSPPA